MNARFPIRILSERTGVGTSTLRAWERRYGLLTPERTPKGHRLYGERDVERVGYILSLLQEGHSLPAIAGLLSERVAPPDAVFAQDLSSLVGVWRDYVTKTLQAIEVFSSERLEAIHNEAFSLYPVDMVTEQLVQPVLTQLGRRWQSRDAGIGEEHFYTSWVRNRLGARFHHALGQASGSRILCAGVPGDHHEIGLMLFSLAALARGYRVLYLGGDLPPAQIPVVVRRSGARAVVLAARTAPAAEVQAKLTELARVLQVPVLLGGFAADQQLPAFEAAGGVRLGSRIEVALKVLGTHVPPHGQDRRTHSYQEAGS